MKKKLFLLFLGMFMFHLLSGSNPERIKIVNGKLIMPYSIVENGGILIENGKIVDIFTVNNIESQIIVASVRTPIHVTEAARIGAHIATLPYCVVEKMLKHPLTDIGIERFLTDWKSVPK